METKIGERRSFEKLNAEGKTVVRTGNVVAINGDACTVRYHIGRKRSMAVVKLADLSAPVENA